MRQQAHDNNENNSSSEIETESIYIFPILSRPRAEHSAMPTTLIHRACSPDKDLSKTPDTRLTFCCFTAHMSAVSPARLNESGSAP